MAKILSPEKLGQVLGTKKVGTEKNREGNRDLIGGPDNVHISISWHSWVESVKSTVK